MFLDLRLKISTGRDKNLSMSEWIDKLEACQQYLHQNALRRGQIFGPMAARQWEALELQLQRDVADLNKSHYIMQALLLCGEISINAQSSSSPHELNLAKRGFPQITLTVTPDSNAQSIKIHQVRKETLEGDEIATVDRLQLHLNHKEQMSIRDRNGKELEIGQVSEYILRKFLEKP
jgi:hypothetical protein